jgi:type I restriction enzyme S subunit
MSEWTTKPFGERVVFHDDQRRPVRARDRRIGVHPYYGASGVIDYVDGFLFDGRFLLIAEDGENLRSRSSPIAFIAEGRFWVNNHAHVVRANSDNDTRYLAYAVQHADISGYVTGSAQPKLSQDALRRVLISAPDRATQERIAAVLASLDDKIESNRRLSHLLEQEVRLLFSQDFDVEPQASGKAIPEIVEVNSSKAVAQRLQRSLHRHGIHAYGNRAHRDRSTPACSKWSALHFWRCSHGSHYAMSRER